MSHPTRAVGLVNGYIFKYKKYGILRMVLFIVEYCATLNVLVLILNHRQGNVICDIVSSELYSHLKIKGKNLKES